MAAIKSGPMGLVIMVGKHGDDFGRELCAVGLGGGPNSQALATMKRGRALANTLAEKGFVEITAAIQGISDALRATPTPASDPS